ncbi:matrixin family metalloprotease [Sandaracinus amylolyticus]|uniref:matrixin family metalloprotease n=1 Tax=Sandaracinus amylolyticus TaxID=927083 RepID=UPI001F00DC82|nr:matrixin family metalloprotease [Sandaracinus amylolyticus]
MTTNYLGAVSRVPSERDSANTVGWLESGWGERGFDANAIGVTIPQYSGSQIFRADMMLNGVNYTWSTGPGSGNRVNAYSIVLHEAGHYYGLDHSSDSSAVMYYAYSGGTLSLRTDDQNGICALYPRSGTSDCTTTGCPSGQVCEGGTCVTMTGGGDGGMCSPCTTGGDCAAGNACLGYSDDAAYCGTPCTTNAQCGGDVCVNVGTAGSFCARFVGSTPTCSTSSSGCTSDSQCSATQRCNTTTRMCEARPTTGGAIGADCGASTECQSGLCFAGRCSQSCDWLSPTSCPGGWYCSGEATGSCGAAGVCVQGTAGSRAIGEACGAATECASLYCANGRCSTPCAPGGASGCAEGFACQVGAVSGCGSCQRSGSLGDPCEVETDCTSRLCAMLEGDSFCTDRCGEGAPCPSGFSCLAAGETSVCVPDTGGLGSECGTNADCLGGICAVEDEESYCTRICNLGAPCPDGFSCVATDDPSVSICRPPSSGGCGCSAPGRGEGARGGLLAIGLLAALATWRARRRR